MKIILCGYHWTGCKALQLLLKNGHHIFVYTHENPYHIPSLIDFCKEEGVDYSTENISKSTLPFKPDVICSIYYKYIISKDVIDSCNRKIFNLHPALLPKYRGCSSLTWALINGETKAGFTYHYIDENIDTGKIILQKEIVIEDFDNQGTLYDRAMFRSMDYFNEVLDLVSTEIKGTAPTGESSYYKRECPHNGIIDPSWEPEYIKRFIRAMVYPPRPLAVFEETEIATYEEYLSAKQKSAKEKNN